ncbi:protein kinase domain-containing protein [Oryzihumus leptocrescens]|uniref:non-specific serine/threonine protein kinase n=1 Tax=Oryzihumus leptocrescens TaxID=297536 RepID=A0A542ZIF7_9MICO|nr:serine/threonine-protein kinase [Oryzihumus leptocrescens]TQL60148.1 serine/threonine protein kinase [Oryzihumus leptocrescens]
MEQPTVPGCVLLGQVGRGASGTVWLAERERDGARVAVKVLSGNGSRAELSDQALRELAVLSRTAGEHVVRLHDAVPLADGGLALVLDLADGGSLARVVAGRGHLSAGEAVTVLTPLAGALAQLHEAGVVHADVSPANVLFTREGKPMLADLGVARLAGEDPGFRHGTPGYVAPEVVDGASATPAADVHALGALGWLALTGAVPPPPAVRPPLATLGTGAPEALVGLVERCLAPDPADRPSAREAAVAAYAAAPAEPVRLATGEDPAGDLTHRLRAQAAADPVTPVPSRWRRAASRLPPALRGVPGRSRGKGTTVSTGAATSAAAPRRRRAWALPGVALLAVALLVASGAWAATRHTAPAARVSGGVVQDRQAPVHAPHELLQQLADRRAAAWTARDPAALAAVDAPGSPALHTDVAHVGTLLSRHASYRGLRLTVRAASGTLAGTTATLRARVDTAAYVVVEDGGATRSRPAVAGPALTFTLAWTGQGWRIVSYR